ncbi:MAG: histidinol-phosphate transaminase [Nitrospinae bacterium]|nr:histidinol-phosphate transaminase [Nitrospinota bacterium]
MEKPEALPHISSLILYEGGKPIEELQRELGLKEVIKLASNENPLGTSPRVAQFFKENDFNSALYPDGSGYYLKNKLAVKYKIKPENILLGNGSNEIINFIGQCYLESGTEGLFSDKAFIAYRMSVEAVRAQCVVAETADGFSHSLENFKKCISNKTKVIFIANPNNPTGNLLDKEELLQFIHEVPKHILIVLDEAYYEYNNEELYINSVQEAVSRTNLLVLRTFSKIYGLAGYRLGYAIANSEIIKALNHVREPFNISSPGLKAAEIALDDEEFIDKSRKNNTEGKKYLEEEFIKSHIEYIPTFGNFFLVNVGNGIEVTKKLEAMGIIVRPMAGYGFKEHIRVTIGTPQENKTFIKALNQVYKK